MDSFIFSLNATMPVFLVMVFGWVLTHLGLLNEAFTSMADRYVFRIALPCQLFLDIAQTDLRAGFDPRFVVFCFTTTFLMFSVVWFAAAKLLPDKYMVGAFTQASCRGSAAVLGIAFVNNIYGNSGMTPLMIVAAVPLFNIFSVILLTLSARDNAGGTQAIRKSVVGILKNPIILSIFAGLPFSLLNISIPQLPLNAIDSIGGTATPIALLSIGAGFQGAKALSKLKPTAVSTFIKLVLLPALVLPAAAAFGFRSTEMVAILIMVGAPTTVTSYIMARNMNNDAELSSSVIVLSTLLSSVTLTLWIFLLSSQGLI